MIYHKKFRHIHPETLMSVRTCIKSGLFKADNSTEMKEQLIQTLHETLCSIYKIPVTQIQFDVGCLGVGCFCQSTNIITINKPSLITYLHEFFHYLSHTKNRPNTEELAKGWSHSVYFLATPKLFENAINKGLLMYQNKMEDNNI